MWILREVSGVCVAHACVHARLCEWRYPDASGTASVDGPWCYKRVLLAVGLLDCSGGRGGSAFRLLLVFQTAAVAVVAI